MGGFRIIEHPADIGISFWGKTPEECFSQAARALKGMLGGDGFVRPLREVTVRLDGIDRLELLFRWLSEILFYFDAEQLLFSEYEFERFSEMHLEATLRGEPFDPARHETPYYVKAITYHQMKLEKKDEKDEAWHGQVFVDI